MEELMLMTVSVGLHTGPSTASVKTSDFLRSLLCPLPLPQLEKCLCSHHQMGPPPGQIQKSRFLRQRGMRVEVAKAGTKRIERRTCEEGSRAPCLSETPLSSLLKRVESKVSHAAASTSSPFSIGHGRPALFCLSVLSLSRPPPVFPLAPGQLNLRFLGRVEETSLV